MPSCTCASAHTATLSALSGFSLSSTSPAVAKPPPAAPVTESATAPSRMPLRQQGEDAAATLAAARDYLRLLSDCSCASIDGSTSVATESLAVALRDQVEQLALAGTHIDALTQRAWTVAPGTTLGRDLEEQSQAVYTVRHLLGALYDAFGHRSHSHQQLNANAYASVISRMADRLDVVELRVLELVFASLPAMPSPSPAPSPIAVAPTAPPPTAAHGAPIPRTKRTPAKEAVCA